MKRKKPQEIKMLIVDTCWAKAESKLVIAKALKSNWNTIRIYAEELVHDGILERVVVSELVGYKVKQIIKDVLLHQWESQDDYSRPIDFENAKFGDEQKEEKKL